MSETTVADGVQLYNEYRNKFYELRAKQEVELKNSIDKLRQIDPEVLAGLDLPIDMSLQALVPELYKERPDSKIATMQYEEANIILKRIQDFTRKIYEEGKQCLLEYQALTSKKSS